MAETRSAAPKVTYATLAAGQTPEFNKAYDEAVERVRTILGRTHGQLISGKEIQGQETFADTSPSDTRLVLGRFAIGTRADARAAIAAARTAYETVWRDLPWRERGASDRSGAARTQKPRCTLSAPTCRRGDQHRPVAVGGG